MDTDQDRYPTLGEVLRKVKEDADLPQEDIERVELTCLANGEATYRVWTARAEEPVGGHLPPPEG